MVSVHVVVFLSLLVGSLANSAQPSSLIEKKREEEDKKIKEEKPPVEKKKPEPPRNELLKEFCHFDYLQWTDGYNYSFAKMPSSPSYQRGPWGIAEYEDRVFVTVPNNPGRSLNFFNKTNLTAGQCPKLSHYSPDGRDFTSVWRLNVDRWSRMWFVDTGMQEKRDISISHRVPTLNVVDLKENTVLVRRPLCEYVRIPQGLKVVVPYFPKDRKQGYAYILDTYLGRIIVYSWQEDSFWVFEHNALKLTAFEEFFSTRKHAQVVTDNVYSLTLDEHKQIAFVHCRGSLFEFTVSLHYLNNREACEQARVSVTRLGQYVHSTGPHVNVNETIWGVHERAGELFCINEYEFRDSNFEILDNKLPFPVDLFVNRRTSDLLLLTNDGTGAKILRASLKELLKEAPSCRGHLADHIDEDGNVLPGGNVLSDSTRTRKVEAPPAYPGPYKYPQFQEPHAPSGWHQETVASADWKASTWDYQPEDKQSLRSGVFSECCRRCKELMSDYPDQTPSFCYQIPCQ